MSSKEFPTSDIPPDGVSFHSQSSILPYIELIRLPKPAGALYLFIPTVSAVFLAASIAETLPPILQVLKMAGLFLVGSFIFRGAACTWNDIIDQDIDRKVTRTKNRPLARGAISTQAALLYNLGQIAIGFALLARFPPACFYYSIPSVIMIGLYPFAKRITHYPQVVLGFTWGYGFVIGFPAMGIDILSTPTITKTIGCLYGSAISWTILYDTVYAHQDIKDDKREGVKSIAIRFEETPRMFLSVLAVIQTLLFVAAGVYIGAGRLYYLGCLGIAVSLSYMIETVNLEDPADCGWWFFRGSWFLTGGSIFLACFSEYWTKNPLVY